MGEGACLFSGGRYEEGRKAIGDRNSNSPPLLNLLNNMNAPPAIPEFCTWQRILSDREIMAGSAKKKRKGNGEEAKAKKVSAYFNFCNVNRGNVKKSHLDALVNRALSLLWKSLSNAEKAAFSAEPFPFALETPDSAGAVTNIDNGNSHSAINEDDDEEGGNGRGACGEIASVFPHARVKRIIKLDREIHKVSAEVVLVVASAIQLFIEYLSERAFRVSTEKKHKTIRLQDVKEAVGREGHLSDFLEGSLSDLGQDSDNESDASNDRCELSSFRMATSTPAAAPPPPEERNHEGEHRPC